MSVVAYRDKAFGLELILCIMYSYLPYTAFTPYVPGGHGGHVSDNRDQNGINVRQRRGTG